MRCVRIAAVLGSLLLTPHAQSAAEPVIERDAPRPYGYAIGDVIHQELTIFPGPDRKLDSRSIPTAGPLNRWLELRDVRIVKQDQDRIHLSLDYQVFYAPLTVKSLALPGFTLRFEGPAGTTSRDMPAWPFSMAPIHGLSVLDHAATDPLRPEAWPAPPDSTAPLRRMAVSLLAAASALLYLARLRGLIGFDPRGAAFRDARRALRRLRRPGTNMETLKLAFTTVHRAFDRSLGEPLFAERLPDFFASHGQYVGLRQEIQDFFDASYRLFFGAAEMVEETTAETEPQDREALPPAATADFGLERLESLCLACLQADRRRA